MTQEDKELLLKDLLGRISYSIRLKIGDYSDYTLIGVVISDDHPLKVEVTEKDIVYKIEVSVDNVKPYLRSMSSMTLDEIYEFRKFSSSVKDPDKIWESIPNYAAIDWLNKKMFDYRGLIEKGLALEAPKGMYKTE